MMSYLESFDPQTFPFLGRLLLAGLCGALIGADREYHAKVAGIRTHFLVALGSALMMIVSQWGFGNKGGDAGRVAAQVVSGIGFLGAGTIMMHKQYVQGLTTAAGLWTVAGIGLAVGAGMYGLGVTATILVLLGLEVLYFIAKRFRSKTTHVIFVASDRDILRKVTDTLTANKFVLVNYSVDCLNEEGVEKYRVHLYMRERKNNGNENQLMTILSRFPALNIEKVE